MQSFKFIKFLNINIMQKTKSEIVDYIVYYFKTHTRATDAIFGCMYQNKEGNRCAHSICLSDEGLEKILKYGHNDGSNAGDVIYRFTDNIHKEEFRGHSEAFWDAVQSLHDSDSNWVLIEGGNELSAKGVKEAQELKNF